ncbi:MAG: elongation factor P [Planctomycetota bacterium]|nr:elongation factor P [Planctomycetota bacterium]
MIEVTNFKKGLCFQFKGAPVIIVHVTYSTPTARGGATIAKTRMRNLLTGQVLNDSIRSGEKFDEVDLERRPVSFLYTDGTRYHFMDGETYEQFELGKDEIGEAPSYLKDGLEGITSLAVDGRLVSIELPHIVELDITEADPVIKGASAKAQLKNAVLETGAGIQVPSYIVAGEVVRVDTRDGRFVERAKK